MNMNFRNCVFRGCTFGSNLKVIVTANEMYIETAKPSDGAKQSNSPEPEPRKCWPKV